MCARTTPASPQSQTDHQQMSQGGAHEESVRRWLIRGSSSVPMMKVNYALSGWWFDGSRTLGGLKSGSGGTPPLLRSGFSNRATGVLPANLCNPPLLLTMPPPNPALHQPSLSFAIPSFSSPSLSPRMASSNTIELIDSLSDPQTSKRHLQPKCCQFKTLPT